MIDTPHGPARVHLHRAESPWAVLALGHGAGGSVTAPDLRVAKVAALSAGVSVALVEQPYRVAGRGRPLPPVSWTRRGSLRARRCRPSR